MRKDKAGRPAKIKDIQEKVLSLRNANFSFTEIGESLGISKQLARYHFLRAVENLSLDKEK